MVAPAGKSLTGFKHLKLSNQSCLSAVVNSLGWVLLCCQPGLSHGAIATVTRTFSVQASYSSGEPIAMAQVVVYSPENPDQPWTTGQTNEAGEFDFSPDMVGDWEVVIRQAGHGTTVNVPVSTTAIAPIDPQPTDSPTATLVSTSDPLTTSPLQRWVSAGAALWGLIGTVLFFSRGK
ncbi:carboxypeptidase-like regulatory domain-containing protein [Leptothoe spongobia]|uniref:Carboxypeptidase regulatory-like domain-containing protein n=1 Tax=Leptothoe spongobia TAU-MAC 1115 TaxID=1967444 RepID=A0A947DKC9_9CYAN|nr:carboxypeptidase-like regulatory domain-containing protein [Leptothoe spongobia]MBT9317790.1 carboxypeptidase regulatory-like domain-containing protein [Leptothoe spongobia TAU-MAC 1115]